MGRLWEGRKKRKLWLVYKTNKQTKEWIWKSLNEIVSKIVKYTNYFDLVTSQYICIKPSDFTFHKYICSYMYVYITIQQLKFNNTNEYLRNRILISIIMSQYLNLHNY